MARAIFLLLSTFILFSCTHEVAKTSVSTKNDSISYSLGMLYASKLPQNLKDNYVDSISYDQFIQGMKDYIDSANTNLISDEEARAITQTFIIETQKKAHDAYIETFKKNIELGNTFLQENKKDDDVIELKPGLQYKSLYKGWGKQKPLAEDTVLVKYKVLTTNGDVIYDSKSSTNNTVKIALDSAIIAWREVLPLFVTGGKMRIYASYEYAYGKSFSPDNQIEPYSTVIFEIEMVKFIRKNEIETVTATMPQQVSNNTAEEDNEEITVSPPAQTSNDTL